MLDKICFERASYLFPLNRIGRGPDQQRPLAPRCKTPGWGRHVCYCSEKQPSDCQKQDQQQEPGTSALYMPAEEYRNSPMSKQTPTLQAKGLPVLREEVETAVLKTPQGQAGRQPVQPCSVVSWCFEPSQPQRIPSGLNTNFNLSPNFSFHKSLYHKSFFPPLNHTSNSIHNFGTQNQKNNKHLFWSLFIFYEHSEPASSRVTYFILRACTGTGVSHI